MKKRAEVVFRFGDGSTVPVPLNEIEAKLLRIAQAMADSADGPLREAGRKRLNTIADRLANAEADRALSRVASARGGRARPRPAWWSDIEKKARKLLAAGKEPRELTSLIAGRNARSTSQVRRVLVELNILPKAKKRA